MASSSEVARLTKGVMSYMGEISEQNFRVTRIASSAEFKSFLYHLSERAPLPMRELLSSATLKCEDALRVQKDDRRAKKKAAQSNENERTSKRVKITHPGEEETSPSQRVAESDLMAQGCADTLESRANAVAAYDDGVIIKQESEQESFDWTNMTEDTLLVSDSAEEDDASRDIVTQNSRKVPSPLIPPTNPVTPDRSIGSGKHTAIQQTKERINIRADMAKQASSISSNIGDETPIARSESQCPEKALLHTSASEKGRQSMIEDSEEEGSNANHAKNAIPSVANTSIRGLQEHKIALLHPSASEKGRQSMVEDSEEEEPNATHTHKDVPSVANTSVRGLQEHKKTLLPTQYQIEVGLQTKTPAIEALVRAHCLTLKTSTSRPHFNIDDEITKILDNCRLPEFYTARRELYQYLENREKMPGKKLQARTIWDMSNPSEILDTLQTIKTNTADSKIHRAYGQTKLFLSVNTQVDDNYKASVTGYIFNHSAILEELARKKAGSVSKSEIDQMISSYKNEYYAGKKWSAVIDWFGGSGIVLVFVTAGIGSYYVETGWNEFQRGCLHYVAGFLHSIRKLVEALGSDALEFYCRHGCLGSDCIDRVKLAKFTEPDEDEEAEDEEIEDEGVKGEEAEDGEAEDEEVEDEEIADENESD